MINFWDFEHDMERILPKSARAPAVIPERPRPIIEGHGWEATDWTDCPLAKRYGVAGDCRSSRRRVRT